MTFRLGLILCLTLCGCAGFDDYYFDESFAIPSTESSCGCGAPAPFSAARSSPSALPTAPTSAPQSREPELLR